MNTKTARRTAPKVAEVAKPTELKFVTAAKVTKVSKVSKPVKSVKATKTVAATRSTRSNRSTSSAQKVPYRGDYGKIYELAAHATMPIEELVRQASRALKKSQQKVKYDLNVLTNPNHKSNGHKSANVAKRQGWVRLAPCHVA